MTCPNMGCYQGEGSRKGHKVSRQNNYKVRHKNGPFRVRVVAVRHIPPPKSIFRPRNIVYYQAMYSNNFRLLKERKQGKFIIN